MKRLSLSLVALAVLSSSAMAQTYGSSAPSCAKDYKDFWDKINSESSAKMSGEQYSKLSRMALRGFDACSAGDQKFNSASFYEKLGQQANALPDNFWEKVGQEGHAK